MLRCFIAIGLMSIFLQNSSHASQINVLHDFTGNVQGPYNSRSLILDGSTFYGTSTNGGAYHDGTVFKIGVDGTNCTVLHSFDRITEGGSPSGLVLAGTTLVSTCVSTSVALPGSVGYLFKIDQDGKGFSNIRTFWRNSSDGCGVSTVATDGSTIFGTTRYGYAGGGDNLYKINPDGTYFSTLCTFHGPTEAEGFNTRLIIDDAVIYGTSPYGGPGDAGTLFKVGTDGSGLSVLHSFLEYEGDGNSVIGDLVLSGSTLYGVTQYGGASAIEDGDSGNGIIFKINTDGTGYQIIHSFSDGPEDGSHPIAGMTLVGSTLYGTTAEGGQSDDGVIFRIGTDGTNYSIIDSFDGINGSKPTTTLLRYGSELYGITYSGGRDGGGILFSVAIVPEPSSLILFALAAIGLLAYGSRQHC